MCINNQINAVQRLTHFSFEQRWTTLDTTVLRFSTQQKHFCSQTVGKNRVIRNRLYVSTNGKWGKWCTSGGVYLTCIYSHARWELPTVTQVYVAFVWRPSSPNLPTPWSVDLAAGVNRYVLTVSFLYGCFPCLVKSASDCTTVIPARVRKCHCTKDPCSMWVSGAGLRFTKC